MEDIHVFIVDLKTSKVAETVTYNADGSYSIFLNARLSKESQTNGYIHALKHILRDDFTSKHTADVIEYYAHIEDMAI